LTCSATEADVVGERDVEMGPGHLRMPLPRGLTRRGSPVRLRIATGLALAAAGALLLTVIWVGGPDPGVDDGAADVVRVGVVEGQSVPGYLNSSRGELAALVRAPSPGETWALVSLSAYVSPDQLPAVLGGATVAEVYARAPLGATQTQVVRIPAYQLPDDVVAGMLNAAVSRDRERADYTQLERHAVAPGVRRRGRRRWRRGCGVQGALPLCLCRRGARRPHGAGPDRRAGRGPGRRPGARGARPGSRRVPAAVARAAHDRPRGDALGDAVGTRWWSGCCPGNLHAATLVPRGRCDIRLT